MKFSLEPEYDNTYLIGNGFGMIFGITMTSSDPSMTIDLNQKPTSY